MAVSNALNEVPGETIPLLSPSAVLINLFLSTASVAFEPAFSSGVRASSRLWASQIGVTSSFVFSSPEHVSILESPSLSLYIRALYILVFGS